MFAGVGGVARDESLDGNKDKRPEKREKESHDRAGFSGAKEQEEKKAKQLPIYFFSTIILSLFLLNPFLFFSLTRTHTFL